MKKMKASQIKEYIESLFDKNKLNFDGEYGCFIDDSREINKIGYSTNLTPEVVNNAINSNVDIIITHHDAWDFVYGMKKYCIDKLKEANISHIYIHLALDDADFGTNASFMERIGASITEKTTLEEEMFYCGRIGFLDEPMDFESFSRKVESVIGEKVKSWKNNDRKVQKIGFLSGAGFQTNHMKEFVDKNCDVYITGEKILYTVQYAKFTGLNLIVGSHTGTEVFGVESLCKKIVDNYGNVEIIRLHENHQE